MIANEHRELDPKRVSLALVWRNPLSEVRAYLRAREKNNPDCRWAEHANKIRAWRYDREIAKN